MHKTIVIIAAVIITGLTQASVAATDASTPADNRNAEGSKGFTLDDLGRGLKNAANNIEKEIPKIGSAIGNTFKKITEKGSEKPSDQKSAK